MPSRATFIYPTNGASNVNLTPAFQWTSAPGAQAYVLYVGTTPGASNLVQTNEFLQTSYTALNLPAGQPLYARIWTEIGGSWHYAAISFTGAPRIAALVAPANGATNVSTSTTFQWTSVPNAQAYYLYVGTAVGTKNVVDSSETQLTSRVATNMPANRVLYCRIWTELNGAWTFNDSTFTTGSGSGIAILTAPTNGATGVPRTTTFQWTAVAGAQAYYLYVGTSVGTKDVVDSYETQQTSRLAVNMPANQLLYGRMWTKLNGTWSSIDSTFTTGASGGASSIATLTAPVNGAINVSTTHTFRWTSVPNVQAYYLYVGTAQGSKNVVDSYEVQQTAYAAHLPTGQLLYARIWTKLNDTWYSNDSTFTTGEPGVRIPVATGRDDDHDGIDDGVETNLAARFFPVVHYDNGLACLAPHPSASVPGPELKPVAFAVSHPLTLTTNRWAAADYIAIRYILLYGLDCGILDDHNGDNESFVMILKYDYFAGDWKFSSITTDPHRGTGVCENALASTSVDSDGHAHIWVGTRKHSNYVRPSGDSCFGDDKADNPGYVTEFRGRDNTTLASHFLFNIGEAVVPLVTNLGTILSRWGGINPWTDRFYQAGTIGQDTILYGYNLSQSPAPAPATGWFLDGGICFVAPYFSVGSDQFSADGDTHTANVTATTNCAWRMSTNVSWISVHVSNPDYPWPSSDGLVGAGNASVDYIVDPNYGGPRSGAITIGANTIGITQAGR